MRAGRLTGTLGALMVLLMTFAWTAPADALFGRTRDVVNITDAPISTGSGVAPALTAVEKAIRKAAIDRRWVVSKVEEGHLQAELTVSRHFMKVDITFTPETYSINYNDSRVMLYDGKQIHRNYNRWVQELSDRIRQEMGTL